MLFSALKFYLKELKRVSQTEAGKGKILDMLWCALRYGASPNNYAMFDFRRASYSERKSFLTHGKYVKMMKRCNKRSDVWQLQNKFEFAKILGDQYGREFALSQNLSKDKFRKIAEAGKVIYKPHCGGQGRGIYTFETKDQKGIDNAYETIIKMPQGLVEGWLEQNEFLNKLYSKSLNPIRIETLLDKDNISFLGATLTVGNGDDIANASGKKSIFALVNVENGNVITDGCDYNGNFYKQHPITGMTIKGFKIPFWPELKELVKNTAIKFPTIKHIGWDVGITSTGPVIIEGNDDPGYTAFQLPSLTNSHIGTLKKYEHFL